MPAHLYVHVPFCSRKCSYCAFSIAVRRTIPVQRYVRAVSAELQLRLQEATSSGRLRTLYLGGGTPSHLGADGVAALLDAIRANVEIESGAEITIEANPEDVDSAAAARWKRAGINRVSLGVQSFQNPVLRWMHRVHDATRARDAIRLLCQEFDRVSADLIFALPRNLKHAFERDLAELLEFKPGHISLYGLTAEPGTPYARWIERKETSEAEDDTYEDNYLRADAMLRSAGYEHYEVSSFALSGQRSVHNAAYWSGADYLGVGPAAHSLEQGTRRWNHFDYQRWLQSVEGGADPWEGREVLTHENRVVEEVYLGLRTSRGLQLRPSEFAAAESWRGQNWAELENQTLRLTPLGWLRLDALAATLTNRRSR